MQTALFQQRRLCRCVCTRGSYSSLKMGNSQMWARVWAHIWLKHESLRWWRRRQRLQRDVPVWKHYTHYLPAAGCNSLLFCRFSLFFPTVSGFQEKHGETCRHAEQWGCCESLKVNVDCELILNTVSWLYTEGNLMAVLLLQVMVLQKLGQTFSKTII